MEQKDRSVEGSCLEHSFVVGKCLEEGEDSLVVAVAAAYMLQHDVNDITLCLAHTYYY